MNFSMRQLYCLLFSMALLFALSEGRDHRLDHILRLRRRNLKEKFQPSKSYNPLNSALFRSKTQYLFTANSKYFIINKYLQLYKIIFSTSFYRSWQFKWSWPSITRCVRLNSNTSKVWKAEPSKILLTKGINLMFASQNKTWRKCKSFN